eukprot:3586278-Pyramimonas_sp.AAC.1
MAPLIQSNTILKVHRDSHHSTFASPSNLRRHAPARTRGRGLDRGQEARRRRPQRAQPQPMPAPPARNS